MIRPVKNMRLTRACSDARLKAKADGDGPGWIEGYLAVFGNIDRQGERIAKGAFAKSVAERVPKGIIPLMARHFAYGGDARDTIGTITEAKEDEYGLWIHADMLPDDDSQLIRQKVASGGVKGLSVGFELLRWEEVEEDGKYVLEIREARLSEGTVTVRPANESAVITAAKAVSDAAANLGSDASSDRIRPVGVDAIEVLGKAVDALAGELRALRSEEADPSGSGSPDGAAGDAVAFHELDVAMAECELAGNELYLQGLTMGSAGGR